MQQAVAGAAIAFSFGHLAKTLWCTRALFCQLPGLCSCACYLTALIYVEEWMDASAGGVHGGLRRTLASSQEHELSQSNDLTLVTLAGGISSLDDLGPQLATGAGQTQRGGSTAGAGKGSKSGKQLGTSATAALPPAQAAEVR
jgi:hypothetical protein